MSKNAVRVTCPHCQRPNVLASYMTSRDGTFYWVRKHLTPAGLFCEGNPRVPIEEESHAPTDC